MKIFSPNTRAPMGLTLAAALLSACTTMGELPNLRLAQRSDAADLDKFQRDREAILAMAGDYEVSFDFAETVSFVAGYEPKAPTHSSGHEIVRVIRDEPRFISLQHILVVGGKEKFPVKHWRQDWIYEPAAIIEYTGHNSWARVDLSPEQRAGKWAQLVYQVDDGPRYGAVAPWQHRDGVSSWESPPNLRPLPRRDATKRTDYDAILAVNRHALTPDGWVHEQDNSKLILGAAPQILVRETGLNTYTRSSDFDTGIGDAYWQATKAFWAEIRKEWTRLENDEPAFGLTLEGEPQELYDQILEAAAAVAKGADAAEEAARARTVIRRYTVTKPSAPAAKVSAMN